MDETARQQRREDMRRVVIEALTGSLPKYASSGITITGPIHIVINHLHLHQASDTEPTRQAPPARQTQNGHGLHGWAILVCGMLNQALWSVG